MSRTDLNRDATSPFHAFSQGDIILRSADNVDFHVLKAFLAYSSSVFNDMFTMPLPKQSDSDQATKDGKPVVDLTESSIILHLFLSFCYPDTQPENLSLEEIVDLMEAVKKYGADRIEKQLCKKLLVTPTIIEDPLRLFAIAFHFRWDEIGRLAAKNTLSIPRNSLKFSQDLRFLSGIEMFRLGLYRQTCAEAIKTWAQDPENRILNNDGSRPEVWWTNTGHAEKCGGSKMASPMSRSSWSFRTFQPIWWTQYQAALLLCLQECPRGVTVLEDRASNTDFRTALNCPVCSGSKAHQHMMEYQTKLAAAVEDVISNVSKLFWTAAGRQCVDRGFNVCLGRTGSRFQVKMVYFPKIFLSWRFLAQHILYWNLTIAGEPFDLTSEI